MWLCSKDLQKLEFEQVGDDSPEEILMSLKKQQTTYAVVFEILCKLLFILFSINKLYKITIIIYFLVYFYLNKMDDNFFHKYFIFNKFKLI